MASDNSDWTGDFMVFFSLRAKGIKSFTVQCPKTSVSIQLTNSNQCSCKEIWKQVKGKRGEETNKERQY
jgi:hypothetical protein